jgi:isopentenyl-diphosphate delta-isomerase
MRTAFDPEIEKRKKEHIKIAVSDISQVGTNGLENYKFIPNSLPEIDFDKIDTSTIFLQKKVNYPFFVSCMTGGILEGGKLNKNLAKACEKYNIALGVGSQRAAIENPNLAKFYDVRKFAPNIPMMANIGLVQLNYGFTYKEFQKCVDMVDADCLVVHINPIQEVVQPEGNRNWEGLLEKLEKVIDKISVPIIVKEVGFGMSKSVIQRLVKVGVRYIDVAGWGGTNWAMIEGLRGKADKNLGELFSNWGISTAESLGNSKGFNDLNIIGSGGIRNGIEIAKCMSLGADMVGIAAPFAKAGLESEEGVEKLIEKYAKELKVTIFGVGVRNIKELKKIKLVKI